MKSLLQDVRFGLRMLRKSPGFTAVAVITLALGIGANTAIFSLINAIMLRTLPVRDPQRLVQLNWASRGEAQFHSSYGYGGCLEEQGAPFTTGCTFSYPVFEQMKAGSNVFSGVFAFAPIELPMNYDGRMSQIQGLLVSGDFFATLGAHPALGRLLVPSDDSGGAAPTTVLSYRAWQNLLGGDPSVIGKPIWVGKTSATLVGVASPEFPDIDPGVRTDFWLPLSLQPVVARHLPNKTENSPWLAMMARLKPGIGKAEAEATASTAFSNSTTNGPDSIFKPVDNPHIELPNAAHGMSSLRDQFERPLFTLLAAVSAVLLLACVNLAGLMLARSNARRKEVAMRTALGASRFRIVRQLLTESLLLSTAGGGGGIILGYWGGQVLAVFLASGSSQPFDMNVRPDWRVLAFTLLVSVFVGLGSGLAPAFAGERIELVSALKETAGTSDGTSHRRWLTLGNGLVVAQTTIAMLVLVGAGLLVRTVVNLKTVNTGFDPKNLLLFHVYSTYSHRTGQGLSDLGLDLREQLGRLPGVASASYSSFALMQGWNSTSLIDPVGSKSSAIDTSQLGIAPDFFKTMHIPLVAGRGFDPPDLQKEKFGSPPHVAVINESFARRFFGQQQPVGQHFRFHAAKYETEIVGVVGDAKFDQLRDDVQPIVYVPNIYTPIIDSVGEFEVRTALKPEALMAEIRAAISRFDPDLLVTDMKTQMEQIDQNIYQERLIANLSSLFALLALIVACVGIYGLLSYQVTRRTQEIGIRLALGAQREDVLRIVLRQGAVVAILGTAIGTAGALGVTRYLQSFLFGVKPSDPLTLVVVAIILIAVALLASYIPARRAMKTDPMVALRYE